MLVGNTADARNPTRPEGPLLLDPSAPRAIEWAAEMIRGGRVVAIPTDTVYGLAAALGHPHSLARIYELKGRPHDAPLPVLLSSPSHLRELAVDPDERLRSLGARFWPGPLTIVVPARPSLPPQVLGRDVAGRPTVGVRVPDHFLAIEIVERCGGAVAVTSANRSGAVPARTAAEVVVALGASVDAVVDGGRSPGGIASTVVAFDGGTLAILREGAVARGEIEAAWDEIERGAR